MLLLFCHEDLFGLHHYLQFKILPIIMSGVINLQARKFMDGDFNCLLEQL